MRPLHLRAVLIPCLIALAAGSVRGEDLPMSRGVGRPVPDFKAVDARTGKEVALYGFRGKKAAVIVFTSTSCPVGDLYFPRLAELSRKYADRGVAFLAVDSNVGDTPARIAEHAAALGADFPVLKDEGNKIADLLLAERTCETLVVDGRAVLRFRGAIDDQYGLGKRRPRPTKDYLIDALEAILADRPIETSSTSVVGCPIERADVSAGAKSLPKIRPAAREIVEALAAQDDAADGRDVGEVTYAKQVSRIIQEKCQGCHRPGQAGPFSLLDYDDAREHKAVIREVVEDRRMPPWHADPRHGKFSNDRSLTPRQRAELLAWIDRGAPLGDPRDLPEPKLFPKDWTVGQPDAVFTIPEDYVVAAQGALPYQRFVVPTNFAEDKWVQSIEARPGDRSVVHHIVVYLLSPGAGGREREHLGGYAPGDMPTICPPGSAKRIPAGSKLLLEIHYTPNGRIKVDRSSVGFRFATGPVSHRVITDGIVQGRFRIPPGAPNYRVDSEMTFEEDAHLLAFMPHMHLRGKDFRYTAIYPDGRQEVLLSIPAYDFAWQSYYRLAEPKAMPKGTKLHCEAHFDNSASNPANPDPTKEVGWGDQTWEEMMIGYIDFMPDAPVEAKTAGSASAAR